MHISEESGSEEENVPEQEEKENVPEQEEKENAPEQEEKENAPEQEEVAENETNNKEEPSD